MVKIAMNGARGRMGQQIIRLASRSEEVKVVAAFERKGHPEIGKTVGDGVKLSEISEAALAPCEVLIDFSSPEAALKSAELCVKAGKALVIGTTGLDASQIKKIEAASGKVPVVFSPNMSIGANFLFQIAEMAARQLDDAYDIEIVEAHHRLKKDAPSGTAKKLAEVIAKAKGWDLGKVARFGREGLTGERKKEELGIHVIRAGEIVGEHTVILSGPGETLEFKHKAASRDAFAGGALAAACFLAGKKKGLYSMVDVLTDKKKGS